MHRLALVIAVALLITPGCGKPARLDTSSDAALVESKKAITSGMSEPDKMAFHIDCMAAVGDEHMTKTGERAEKGEKLTDKDLYSPLNGMTAAEIKAKAEAMRAGGK